MRVGFQFKAKILTANMYLSMIPLSHLPLSKQYKSLLPVRNGIYLISKSVRIKNIRQEKFRESSSKNTNSLKSTQIQIIHTLNEH